MENNKPKCSKCGSGYVYVRLGGTVVCRRCGAEIKKEVLKNDKNTR